MIPEKTRVKPGDMARVIKSHDGINVGIEVEVCSFQGMHSKLGVIWRCRARQEIVTYMGGVGHFADFADDWLLKIEPPTNNDNTAIRRTKPFELAL